MITPKWYHNSFVTGLYSNVTFQVTAVVCTGRTYYYHLVDVNGKADIAVGSVLRSATYEEKMVWKYAKRAQDFAAWRETLKPKKKGDFLVISAHTTTNHKRNYLHSLADGISHALNLFKGSSNCCDAFYVVEIKKVVHGPKTVQTQLPATVHDWNGEC